MSNKTTKLSKQKEQNNTNDKLKENIIRDINYFLKDERLQILNSNLFIQTINRFFKNNDYNLSYQVWSFYVFFQWFKKYEKFINS